MNKPVVLKSAITNYAFDTHIKDFYKDNAETIKINMQYEICSDTNDISFTPLFVQKQECIRLSENHVLKSSYDLYLAELSEAYSNILSDEVKGGYYIRRLTFLGTWPTSKIVITGMLKDNNGVWEDVPDILWKAEVIDADPTNHTVDVRIFDNTDDTSDKKLYAEFYTMTPDTTPRYCRILIDGIYNPNGYITINDNQVTINGVPDNKTYTICDLDGNELMTVKGNKIFYINSRLTII